MTPALLDDLAWSLDPARLMRDLGFDPDPWQAGVLRAPADRILMLCARQCGKSTTTAVLALHTALYRAGALVLLLSPSQRQSGELFRLTQGFHDALGRPLGAVEDSATTLGLSNGSRVVSLPGNPATIRGFGGVDLLVIDEAAQTDDRLFVAARPMLAASRGRMVGLSTPFGKRGWFHAQWADGGADWTRFTATAWECPRIDPAFLEGERRALGDRWFRQEYECSFEETVDQAFSTGSVLGAFDCDAEPLFAGGGS
jgi:hypothetical protein